MCCRCWLLGNLKLSYLEHLGRTLDSCQDRRPEMVEGRQWGNNFSQNKFHSFNIFLILSVQRDIVWSVTMPGTQMAGTDSVEVKWFVNNWCWSLSRLLNACWRKDQIFPQTGSQAGSPAQEGWSWPWWCQQSQAAVWGREGGISSLLMLGQAGQTLTPGYPQQCSHTPLYIIYWSFTNTRHCNTS